MKTRTFLGASVVAAIVASFCCILPMVFAVAGVSIVGASAAFAAWRPYLLAVTFALLGFGFYYAYRPAKEACEPGAVCARPGVGRSGRVTLWIATVLVVAFATFPYYSGPVAELVLAGNHGASVAAPSGPSLERVVLEVEGMDCAACASTVEKMLKAIPGVSRASVSYETGRAEVEYDTAVVRVDQLESVIRDAGYRTHKLS